MLPGRISPDWVTRSGLTNDSYLREYALLIYSTNRVFHSKYAAENQFLC
jgi:hypothetical protein